MKTLLIGLFIALTSAFFTAYFTVRFSLKRFRSDRWWERKLDAYTALIESLHKMKNYFDEIMQAQEEGRELSEGTENELRQKWRESAQEIDKAIDVGSFIIAEEVVQRLREFQAARRSAANEPEFYRYLDSAWLATKDCLEEVLSMAQSDLEVTERFTLGWIAKLKKKK